MIGPMPAEPCRHCGAETAAGAWRFDGRRRLAGEGAPTFVCPICRDDGARTADAPILTSERLAALSFTTWGGAVGQG